MARGRHRRLGDLVVSPEAVTGLYERLGEVIVAFNGERSLAALEEGGSVFGRDMTRFILEYQRRLEQLSEGGWYAPQVLRELQSRWLPRWRALDRRVSVDIGDVSDIERDADAMLAGPSVGVEVGRALSPFALVAGGVAVWFLWPRRRRR